MNDLDLLALHIDALFLTDARNRLLTSNEPDPPPAPRLYLGRTTLGNAWRFRHDLPDPIVRDLEAVLRAETTAVDLAQPPRCLDALRDTLSHHAPVSAIAMGPAWHFPDPVPPPRHETWRITPERGAILRPTHPRLASDLPFSEPCLAIIRDGRLASLCFSSRNTPAAAEAGLETLAHFRGHGYAASAAAAWAGAVRGEDRIPLYSTEWDNLPSRAVAQKLGLILYAADLSLA